jgi:hypothetical protein
MKQPCTVCDNTGWVCENHADRPFEEEWSTSIFQRLPRSDSPLHAARPGNEQLVRLAFRHSPPNGQRQGIVKRPTKIESSLDAASQMRDHKRFAHHFTIRPNLSVAICTECYTDDAVCASRRRSPFEKDNRSMWSVANRNH